MAVDGADSDGDGRGEDDARHDGRVPGDQRQPVVAHRAAAELDAGRQQAAATVHVEPLGPAVGATADAIQVPARRESKNVVTSRIS